MNPRAVATQHTLDFVNKCLPRNGCSILEVGCGQGHLALRLQQLGHHVTAIDTSVDAVSVARGLGVNARVDDIKTCSGTATFDCVLFTRSLHHTSPVELCLENANKLLKPQGLLIAEEFALERMDEATAAWFYGLKALQEQLDAPEQLLYRWRQEHDAHHLCTGVELMRAVSERFDLITVTDCAYLYRYCIAGLEKQNSAQETNTRALQAILDWENLQIQQRQIRPLGLRIVANKV